MNSIRCGITQPSVRLYGNCCSRRCSSLGMYTISWAWRCLVPKWQYVSETIANTWRPPPKALGLARLFHILVIIRMLNNTTFYYMHLNIVPTVQGPTYRRALGLVKLGLTYREWRVNEIEAGGRVIYGSGSLLSSNRPLQFKFPPPCFPGRMIE